jgi:hypothetical protein
MPYKRLSSALDSQTEAMTPPTVRLHRRDDDIRRVLVEDHNCVHAGERRLQIADVTRMQKIEDAVGADHARAGTT